MKKSHMKHIGAAAMLLGVVIFRSDLSWGATVFKPWGPMSQIERAAREEGRLVAYVAPGHILPPEERAIGQFFKERFGVEIEWTSLDSGAIGQRVLAEARTRQYVADLFMDGPTRTIEEYAPRGLVQPILAPSTLEEGVWRLEPARNRPKERDWSYIFLGLVPSFIVNTTLAPPGSEPKSYQDLLDPKWKGKIVLQSPGLSGSGSGWFRTTYKTLELDTMRALAKQVGLVRNVNDVPEGVARGQFAIGIAPTVARSRQLIRAGAPVRFVTAREGGHLTNQGMSLLAYAPHPNAAKLFIQWFYTKEGQTIYNQHHLSISLRKDVAQDYLSPEERYVEGAPLFIQPLEDLAPGRPPAILELGRQIFEEGK